MKLLRRLRLLSLLPFLLLGPAWLGAAESPVVKKGAVRVSLVSDAAAIVPGQKFTVALRMRHDPHWHSYWIAPGTGYPTAIKWTLPPGFSAGDIQWPTPQVVKDTAGKITGNGYTDEVYLLVDLTPPAALTPSSEVKLGAAVEWLMCSEVCMPGDAKLDFTMPTAPDGTKTAPLDENWTAILHDAREKLPITSSAWNVTASHTDKTVTVRLTPKAPPAHEPADLHLFAADGFDDYALPQKVRAENSSWVIEAPLDEAADKSSAKLTGVIASSNGWGSDNAYGGLAFSVPFTPAAGIAPGASPQPATAAHPNPAVGTPVPAAAVAVGGETSLGLVLLFAFLGGAVLNLMPCVFPVLGIKILGFVNQAGNDRRKITMHGLVFTLGVLLSFWILSGALLILRAGGAQLGWGAQLQSPAFVFGMAAFLLVFALNMSGLFEVGLAATAVGGNLQMKEGYAGSFFTGALAVLVATPCSAPMLAPALGAAFSSAYTPVESMAIFTAIALGLSLPYLLLSIFPSAVKILPRPGAWMETFKQFMAFPLYATVGALLWVLAAQTKDDDYGLLLVIFGLVLIAMAVWAYGRFGQAYGKPARQNFGRGLAALLLVAGLATGWPKSGEPAPAKPGEFQVTWEKWSPEAIASARAAGHYVYVDFTARWCATCQTNKAALFHNDEVLASLAKNNFILLRGDWTNRDPQITAELARWNRSAVPFNLMYAPAKSDPVVLPEVLLPSKFFAALDQLKGPAATETGRRLK